MNLLFDVVPETLFHVLASPKKELYAQAIMVLKEALESNLTVSKKEYIEMLIDELEPLLQDSDFTDESEDLYGTAENTSDNRKKALLLFQKLKKDGWMDVEYALNSTEEYISIPEHVSQLMDVLSKIASNSVIQEYNSPVYATYSALSAVRKGHPDEYYNGLLAAYENTRKLEQNLKQCLNGINWHINHDLSHSNLNDLLKTMFGDEKGFQEEIIDRLYYPIKTRDSIPKYKEIIITTLNEWLNDQQIIDCIVDQGITRKRFPDMESAIDQTIQMMNDVIRIYETIEGLVGQIDMKLNDYISRMTDLIRYKNNQDSGIKSILYRILTDDQLLTNFQDQCNLYSCSFFDGSSLYKRPESKETSPGKPKPVQLRDRSKDHEIINQRKQKLKEEQERKEEYLRKNFHGRDRFTSKEVEMKNKEDFVQFLLCVSDGLKKDSGYKAVISKDMIQKNEARIPEIEFTKEKKNV